MAYNLQAITNAYYSGDTATLNALIQRDHITLAQARVLFPQLSDTDARNRGVLFYDAGVAGSNIPGVGAAVASIPTPLDFGVLPWGHDGAASPLAGLLANPLVVIGGAALLAFIFLKHR